MLSDVNKFIGIYTKTSAKPTALCYEMASYILAHCKNKKCDYSHKSLKLSELSVFISGCELSREEMDEKCGGF